MIGDWNKKEKPLLGLLGSGGGLGYLAGRVSDVDDLTYTISNSGSSFTLRSVGTVNYTVDWGDGSDEETSTSTTLAHTYSSSGTYKVKINSNSGSYRPKFDSSGDEDQITSVKVSVEDSSLFSTNIERAFRGAQNMTEYTQVSAATSSVTDFERTWLDCSGLTSFPLIDTSSGTNFVATWRNCSDLTTFPQIDTSSATTFQNTWMGCNFLNSFPTIDTSNASNITGTWRGCARIITFPSLDFSSGANFERAWQNCTRMTTYPANRFDTTGTLNSVAFRHAWLNCALTAQSIENILTSLDTNGAQNITLGISGGSNAAKSTWITAANTAYTNLINKGWTISYNS